MMVIFCLMELVHAEKDLPAYSVNIEFVSMMVDFEAQIFIETLAVNVPPDSLEVTVNLVRTEISTNRPNSSQMCDRREQNTLQ